MRRQAAASSDVVVIGCIEDVIAETNVLVARPAPFDCGRKTGGAASMRSLLRRNW
jgi:hypothetical protein